MQKEIAFKHLVMEETDGIVLRVFQFLQIMRVILGDDGHRPAAAGTDFQRAVFIDVDAAVAAQTGGGDFHGGHSGAPAAHLGPFGIETGQAVFQHGDIRGGAAHIEDESIGGIVEEGGADDAGGGAGKDRLDGTLSGDGFVHQTAVAFYDHNGNVESQFAQYLFHGAEQIVDDKDQSGVEDAGNGALVDPQNRGELVSRHGGNAEDLFDHLFHGVFMALIPHTADAGNGHGIYLVF